jgi:hypothetical protein
MPHPIRTVLTPRRALGLAAGAAIAAAALAGTIATGQSPGPRTVTLIEKEAGATFTHIRNTPPPTRQANMAGDVLVFTNPVVREDGTRAGRFHTSCVTTIGARDFRRSLVTCSGVMQLDDGTITVAATLRAGGGTVTAAVTGGTGAYDGARGTLVSTPTRGGSRDVISLRD